MKKSFRFKKDQLNYEIKVRKRPWWLLLLLLLPLLLLIRFEKDVYIQTIDAKSKKPVANAEVNFKYDKAFAYDSGRFFTNDAVVFRTKSDSNGVAVFKKMKYSLYSYLFKHFSEARSYALNGCYSSDTLAPVFHSIDSDDKMVLELNPVLIPLDFRVVDKDDSESLPGATVNVVASFSGNEYEEKAVTGPDGKVIMNKLPKCGKVTVRAGAEGYYPDSIVDKTMDELLGDVNVKRLLKLKPIRKPIEFFVVDCRDPKLGLAGVEVTIEFDKNGKKTTRKVITNEKGVGKGVYDSAHVISLIHLSGELEYYKPGELKGWHKVGDFINYPKDKRTFCLEPDPNPLRFRTIDERTRKGLPASNTITIVNSAGQTKTVTKSSNADGYFTVSINPGDKISIHSQYPPDYEDNDTKVKDQDGIALLSAPEEARTIPLKPKETDLVFRTLDGKDGSLVPGASLQILVDGTSISGLPNNSGNGEFTVHVPVTAEISIAASKQGYGSNDTKIRNKPVKLLMSAPQDERDIPLKKDDPPAPCKGQIKPVTTGNSEDEYDMGNPKARFIINYDMDEEPDRMVIYCGKGTGGTVLFDTGGPVKKSVGSGALIDLSKCGGTTWVTVRMYGKVDSRWTYSFDCLD